MSELTEKLKALPDGNDEIENMLMGEGLTISQLKALAVSHEKLLAAAKSYGEVGDYMPAEEVMERYQVLKRAIAEAEKI